MFVKHQYPGDNKGQGKSHNVSHPTFNGRAMLVKLEYVDHFTAHV